MHTFNPDFYPTRNIALSPFGFRPRRALVWRSRLRNLVSMALFPQVSFQESAVRRSQVSAR